MSDTSIIDFQLKMVIGELFVKIDYFCLEKEEIFLEGDPQCRFEKCAFFY